MLYNNSNYKGNNIDSKNILYDYFNPYEYNIEGNIKDKKINKNIRSEAHINRYKIRNK